MKLNRKPTTASIFLLLAAAALAVPPKPEWLRQADPDAIERLRAIHQDAINRGLNAPAPSVLNDLQGARRDDEITLRVAVILVDFDDKEADRDSFPRAHYEEMLFSVGEYETGSMRD